MRNILLAGVYICLCAPAYGQDGEIDKRQLRCMAHIVYTESRGESERGQYDVAWSMIFRAEANLPEFGGSDLCGVAYKYARKVWQYDGAKHATTREPQAWKKAVDVAFWAMRGYGRPKERIMFFCDQKMDACGGHDSAARRGRLKFARQEGSHRMYTDTRFPTTIHASAQ